MRGYSDVNARLAGRLELEKLVGHVEVMILVLDEQMAAPMRRSNDDDRLAGSQHQIATCIFCTMEQSEKPLGTEHTVNWKGRRTLTRKRALHNPRLGIAELAVAGHRVRSTGRQRRRSLLEPTKKKQTNGMSIHYGRQTRSRVARTQEHRIETLTKSRPNSEHVC